MRLRSLTILGTVHTVNATHSQRGEPIDAGGSAAMIKWVRSIPLLSIVGALALAVPGQGARADAQGMLETIHKHITRTSTVTDNGDLNPYAVVVAPVSAGKIQKDDVLVDNFNNLSNLQGTGTTIGDYHPSTKKTFTFADRKSVV